MSTELILAPASDLATACLFAPTPQAAKRTVEFFTVTISKVYGNASFILQPQA